MMFQPSDAEMGAHSLAARVAVRDKRPLEQRPHIIAQQVVHYTVAEVRSKYLSFNRNICNKADAPTYMITAFFNS